MAEDTLQKAEIIILLKNEVKIPCQFNPTDYTISKQSNWKETGGKGKAVPELEFSGGKPATLKMKLYFDTTKPHELVEVGSDVRDLTNKLWDLVQISEHRRNPTNQKGEPPQCEFRWGTTWNFTAVITNLTQKFTMFKGDGTPVRATVDVTFKQVKDDTTYPFQNPTSRSEPRRTRVVQAGDRLDLIAFEEFGDSGRWYDLALANDLEDPMLLQSGQILVIPLE